MDDTQDRIDERGIALNEAGLTDLRYPIVVLDREHKTQQTVGRFTMSVNLPHDLKGTHMSRFIEVLNEHRGEVTMRTLPTILADLKRKLDGESVRIEVCFPYFIGAGGSEERCEGTDGLRVFLHRGGKWPRGRFRAWRTGSQ